MQQTIKEKSIHQIFKKSDTALLSKTDILVYMKQPEWSAESMWGF